MIQQVIVILIFIAATVYIARLIYKSFSGSAGCQTGCGKCSAVDFDKIEKQLKKKSV